jgi:hypothetical protein
MDKSGTETCADHLACVILLVAGFFGLGTAEI